MLRMPSSLNTGWAQISLTTSVPALTTQCTTTATWTSERTVPSGSCSFSALLVCSTCPTKSCTNKTDGPCGPEENTFTSSLLITISIVVESSWRRSSLASRNITPTISHSWIGTKMLTLLSSRVPRLPIERKTTYYPCTI